MTGYTWDAKRRVYVDKRGKVIAAAVIIRLRDAIADHAGEGFVATTADYLKGDITLNDWANRFATLIQDSTIAGYLLGRGGANAVTAIDNHRTSNVLEYHLKAARGFGADLANSDVALTDQSPALDENGDVMTDDNGDVVDENGDPILDSNGDPISADAAASLLGGALGLLSRAQSYDSAALSGFSAGQGSAWGVDLPESPPVHSRCRCVVDFTVDPDGQIIANWTTAGDERTCLICIGFASEYSDWPTGVYTDVGSGDLGDMGDGG